jgi:hypothetical protein
VKHVADIRNYDAACICLCKTLEKEGSFLNWGSKSLPGFPSGVVFMHVKMLVRHLSHIHFARR